MPLRVTANARPQKNYERNPSLYPRSLSNLPPDRYTEVRFRFVLLAAGVQTDDCKKLRNEPKPRATLVKLRNEPKPCPRSLYPILPTTAGSLIRNKQPPSGPLSSEISP